MCPRILIETKHTYQSLNAVVYGVNTDSNVAATHYNANRPVILTVHPTYPVTGTDESNRIGRKIHTESLISEFFLSLYNTLDNENLNTIYDYYSYNNSDTDQQLRSQVSPQQSTFNSNEQNLDVSIRHMFVEFEPENVNGLTAEEYFAHFWNWFTELNIYTGAFNMHSNRQQVKRESTGFTGTFNILHDKVIHLDLHHPVYHGNVVIPYKRTLNFDGIGAGFPTNKMVIELFIGPTNPYIDYGSMNLGNFITDHPPLAPPNIYVANLASTLKLSFTDL